MGSNWRLASHGRCVVIGKYEPVIAFFSFPLSLVVPRSLPAWERDRVGGNPLAIVFMHHSLLLGHLTAANP